MAIPAKTQLDESTISVYEEQLLTHADTAYRFAFALTLSLDGASKIVRRAYESIAQSMEKIQASAEGNGVRLLIAETWKAYADLKGETFHEGQSAVTKAFKPLPLAQRAAVVAVDVAGLGAADAAQALGIGEKELRQNLSGARKALMASGLEF